MPVAARAAARPLVAREGMFAAILVVLVLSGCATPQADALRSAPPATLPAAAHLTTVPLIEQSEYQCGPAALAMALAADHIGVSVDQLVQEVYLPAAHGALQIEMLAAARRHGALAVTLAPDLRSVFAEVAAGTPVVVLQNLSLPWLPRWHYAVVVGYDLSNAEVVLHSGGSASSSMPLELFERTWARSQHWAIVATDPARLPATPGTDRLLSAASALEQVDPAAAARAYQALTLRAPISFAAWMGRGNSAYAIRDFAAAADSFEHAATLAPASGDVYNNLALTRWQLGDVAAARAAIERAVALGGARQAHYLQTQAAIAGAILRGGAGDDRELVAHPESSSSTPH